MKKANKTTKRTVKPLTYNGIDDMGTDVSTVLRSLIHQDGRFTTQEASAISKICNNLISVSKLKLEAAKMQTSTSKAASKNVLALK
tara:strand:+ start:2811 stop:3068 length:258 start_codon:yes stop_codon:yes gene_type:complete